VASEEEVDFSSLATGDWPLATGEADSRSFLRVVAMAKGLPNALVMLSCNCTQ
jgi:hypothetical protein